MPNRPRQADMRLLDRPSGMRSRHFRQRAPYILDGQVLQRDGSDDRKQRSQRVSVSLDRLGGSAGQTFGQPVNNSLLNGVAVASPHTRIELRVQLLKPVPDLGLGLPADLLADPLTVRVEPERDHATPAPSTGPVMGAVPAVSPMIEVDAVFAIAATLSISHKPSARLGSEQWLPSKTAATRKLPLTSSFLVELRGFEPLTPSMRTRCATGLRYSPWNLT